MVSLGVEKCGRVEETCVCRKRIMRAFQPFTARERVLEGSNVNYKSKTDIASRIRRQILMYDDDIPGV